MVGGMEADKSHAFMYFGLYAVNHFIGNVVMAKMSPPDENVGFVKNFLSETAIGIVKSCGSDGDLVTS